MTEVLPVTVADTARLGERVLAEVEQVIVGKPEPGWCCSACWPPATS